MDNRISGRIDLSDYLEGKELAQATHRLKVPGKVSIVVTVPACDFCSQGGEVEPGPFDFATRMGPWAHGCEQHYLLYRASPNLGTGTAQIWLAEVDDDEG